MRDISPSLFTILLIGGTLEAPRVASELGRTGARIIVSNASSQPQKYPRMNNVHVRRGALDCHGMQSLVRRKGIRVVVDVSHPYAGQVSRIAREAARRTECTYLRYQRPPGLKSRPGIKWVSSHAAASEYLRAQTGNILLCIGVLNIDLYTRMIDSSRLFARIMPRGDSVLNAIRSGIKPENIICSPSRAANTAENIVHLHLSRADWMVTKDSGKSGGAVEKAAAAQRYGAGVLAIERPRAEGREVFSRVEKLLDRVRTLLA